MYMYQNTRVTSTVDCRTLVSLRSTESLKMKTNNSSSLALQYLSVDHERYHHRIVDANMSDLPVYKKQGYRYISITPGTGLLECLD